MENAMRLALLAIPLLVLSTPAISADLDGPVYRERDVVIERSARPRIVERERIIEHHHFYEPAPVYTERRIYTEPRVYYAPRVYAETYYDRPHHYAYAGWRPGHFFPRRYFSHRHHHRGW